MWLTYVLYETGVEGRRKREERGIKLTLSLSLSLVSLYTCPPPPSPLSLPGLLSTLHRPLRSYGNMFPRTLLLFLSYVAFDEIVNHGPLKKYVWGEDKHPHGHAHEHGGEQVGAVESIHEEGDSETLRLARAALHVENEG